MGKRRESPIRTWIVWSISVLGVFLLVTWEYFVAGFTHDASNITYLIFGFFVYGFIASALVARYLQAEVKSLKYMEMNQRIGDANTSDAAAMFDAALERIRRGDQIDIRNLITAYATKIKARVENVSVISGMLITIGLLGTVVGLIITVTGLGHVLSADNMDYVAMQKGLKETVAGMGTAFYTTFFGALLGGVVLKVLGSEMKKSATLLVADTLRFGELYISQQSSQTSSEALVELEARVGSLGRKLAVLGTGLSSVIDIIDSKQTALATGLGELLSTVEGGIAEASRHADERIGALVATVEETNRRGEERTEALVATVEETNRHANERLEAMVSITKETVMHTHSKADERLGALVITIDKVTEETHRLADERLGSLIDTVQQTTQDTHRQANERLVELIDTVGLSIDQTRKRAEEQLGAKASNLALKLTEAAGVLATLTQSAEKPEAPED